MTGIERRFTIGAAEHRDNGDTGQYAPISCPNYGRRSGQRLRTTTRLAEQLRGP
jgi:hypothetical protein